MNRAEFFSWVEALESANRSSPRKIAALQERSLRALLAHAAVRSPFYRRTLAGFDLERCPLSALPTTTKEELQGRFDDVVTDRALRREEVRAWAGEPRNAGTLYLGRYVPCVTSGTTGRPALVVYDEEALFRSCYAPGVARGGAPRAEGETGPPPRMRGESRQAFICETRALAPSHVAVKYLPAFLGEARIFSTTRSIAALVEELNEFRPNAIWCYPSILELLAQERLAGRLRVPDAGARLTVSGEPLGESTRALARRAWSLEVADSYGMTECLSVARTCPEGAMHLMSDLCILEVLDGDGRPVPDGELGSKIAVTNLMNFTQPILRCEIGDVTGVSPDPCPCGWPFPVLLPVRGRTADLFYISRPEGGYEQVSWARFGFIFLIEGLRRSRLAQTGRDRFTFSYERAAPDVPLDLPGVFARELERVGLRGRIEVALREDPTLSAGAGKFRQFVNLVGPPGAEEAADGGDASPRAAGGFPM